MKPKYTKWGYKILDINEDTNTLKAVFSTGDKDRYEDVIDQEGWLLTNFLENPVVLFGHQNNQPPIGKVIDLGYKLLNGKKALVGEIKFAVEEYDFAKTIYNLYKGGYMRAFSVGFLNHEVEVNDDGERKLIVNELVELSAVPVPANPHALVEAKEAGVDMKMYKKWAGICGVDVECPLEKKTFNPDDILKAISDLSTDIKKLQASNITRKSTSSQKAITPRVKGADEAKLKRLAVRSVNRAIHKLRQSKRNIIS